MTPNFRRLAADSGKSLQLWRVWRFLGLQDIKARYRRSFFGPTWLVLNMAIFVGSAGCIYGLMFGQDMAVFLPYLTAGLAVWGFLVASLSEAGNSFIIAEGYIKQFAYPKQIYLLRMWMGFLVILAVNLFAAAVVQLFFGQVRPLGWLLALPGLAILLLTGLGHIGISAYLSTRFRDIPHLLAGLLQVLFFMTPIMYPIQALQLKHLDFVYEFNPYYHLIDIVRYPILTESLPPISHYGIAGGYMLLVWLAALLVARWLDARLVFLL